MMSQCSSQSSKNQSHKVYRGRDFKLRFCWFLMCPHSSQQVCYCVSFASMNFPWSIVRLLLLPSFNRLNNGLSLGVPKTIESLYVWWLNIIRLFSFDIPIKIIKRSRKRYVLRCSHFFSWFSVYLFQDVCVIVFHEIQPHAFRLPPIKHLHGLK